MGLVVAGRTSNPILTHVRFSAAGSELEIAATDLELSSVSTVEAFVDDAGQVCVPYKKLHSMVKSMDADDVALVLDDDRCTLSIKCGAATFEVRCLPAEDFPQLGPGLDSQSPHVIPAGSFRELVARTAYAISKEESRFQLSGALIQIRKDYWGARATDGSRMSVFDRSHEAGSGYPGDEDVLVPRKALVALGKGASCEDLELRISANHLSFTIGRRTLVARVMEGSFPDFERVIADEGTNAKPFPRYIVNRKDFIGASRRVGLIATDKAPIARMVVGPEGITMSTRNPDVGAAEESVPFTPDTTPPQGGAVIEVGVNPLYIADALEVMETTAVVISILGPSDQIIFREDGGSAARQVSIVMPIRL
jgi:DNA polymerase-3 subunit beta